MERKMEKNELLKRAADSLDRVKALKTGIELCDNAIETLGEQPEIIINGDYGRVILNAVEIGLDRKIKADIAKYIETKIAERRNVMADKLEDVLDAIDEVLTDEPVEYPYPMKPKAFGVVSPDDVDL